MSQSSLSSTILETLQRQLDRARKEWNPTAVKSITRQIQQLQETIARTK